MNIYLIGFMGCGKSTYGRLLAVGLGYDFLDMDDLLERELARPLSEVFREPQGEMKFRHQENVLLQHLAEEKKKNRVIAAGGGAPCYFNNMEIMKNSGLTVYIEMPPAVLFHRLALAKATRPMIASLSDAELMEFIYSCLKEREAFYRQAHLILPGNNLPLDTLLSAIRCHPLFSDQPQSSKG
jgi:shikimate kinase